MKCDEVKKLLSALVDDELDVEAREAMEAHISTCPGCAQERAGFEDLSKLTQSLQSSDPPARVWSRVARDLAANKRGGGRFSRRGARSILLEAVVLLAIGLSVLAYVRFKHSPHHPEVNLAEYTDQYSNDPHQAQLALRQRWSAVDSDPEMVAQEIGYRPVVNHLPEGYRLSSFCLLSMPCCRCPQAMLVRADGSSLSVFEYEADQPAFLGDCPHIRAVCANQPTTLVQIDNYLAVTWKNGGRFVTIVGARDVDEASRLVAAFSRKG